jgi:predicted secreted protein
MILVAHCVLNQNAKIDRCAYYPGAMREVTQTLLDASVGFLQIPCPELMYLGLDRQVEKGRPVTIESEDDRVALRMNEGEAKTCCQKIAADLAWQIQEYQRNGFAILGVLGINGSPTYGVETSWSNGNEVAGHGVLINALVEECQKRKVDLHLRGIKAKDPESAVAALQELLD